MTIDELNDYLTKLSPMEKVALTLKEPALEEISGYYKTRFYQEQPHVMSADRYLTPDQEITFGKHYRFMTMTPHKHDFIELVYAYKGDFVQVVNDSQINMAEGDVCLLDTNVLHTIQPLKRESVVLNVLMRKSYFTNTILFQLTNTNLLSDFLINALYKNEMDGKHLIFRTANNPRIRHFIGSAMCERLEPDVATETVISSYVLLLFSELLRISKSDIEKSTPNNPLFDALAYIEKEFKTTTLKETAEKFHYNPAYFSRLLKKHYGKSFNEISFDLRLKEVEHLLKNSSIPVETIIEEAGFSNQSYFYQQFRDIHQMTPAVYRAKNSD